MSTRKRPYRPKVKGCYECSQRRVSCDRREPECGKCCSRGLKCSGTDGSIRIRFTPGVNSRGKWAGETIQSLCEKREQARRVTKTKTSSASPDPDGASQQPQTPAGTRPNQSSKPRIVHFDNVGFQSTQANVARGPHALSYTIEDYLGSFLETVDAVPGSSPEERPLESSRRLSDSGLGASSPSSTIPGALFDDLPLWKRDLLHHYSVHIASEMIAVDGRRNGWRHIVLPMARSDQLVMNAVLAVSAFHQEAMLRRDGPGPMDISAITERPREDGVPSPQALYNASIQGLRCRSNLANSSQEDTQATLVAVLVLLVAAMVTGRDDYSTILGMLHSATKVLGGETQLGTSELGGFLVRQVRKMRVYAAPHVSEWAGLETLSSESKWNQVFDCVVYSAQNHPQTITAVCSVMQQAHDIYLHAATAHTRAVTAEAQTKEANEKIENFKVTLGQMAPDEPGRHVMVWATYLVAAASSLDEHRRFMEGALLQHYNRSRFANLLRGIQHLPHIWAKSDEGGRWTQLLPEARLFLM